MIFLQNKRNRKGKKAWFLIFAILAITGASNDGARLVISKFVISLSAPFAKTAQYLNSGWEGIATYAKNKSANQKQLDELKEKEEETRVKLLMLESLKDENSELKSFLSQKNSGKYIFGTVTLRPPQSPYDMIVIDAGAENGVAQGMKAIAFSSAIIGHVSEVFPRTSKIKLTSLTGEETNIFLEKAKVSAIATGIGGGNLEIKIPGSVKIEIGDNALTESSFPFLVGVVEKSELDPITQFQKIILRTPVNYQELRRVFIEKHENS